MADVKETYPEPHMIEEVITIAVPDASWNPLEQLGEFVATSPEDHRLLVLLDAERDLASGGDTIFKAWGTPPQPRPAQVCDHVG